MSIAAGEFASLAPEFRGQPERCQASFVGHPSCLGPVDCILTAGHEDANDDDRHAGGAPLFRWTDGDAALQLAMNRARERRLSASALSSLCVECAAPCQPVVKGRCSACVAAGIGADRDGDEAEGGEAA